MIESSDGPPDGVLSSGIMGAERPRERPQLVIGLFDTEDDLHRGEAALTAMDGPPEPKGEIQSSSPSSPRTGAWSGRAQRGPAHGAGEPPAYLRCLGRGRRCAVQRSATLAPVVDGRGQGTPAWINGRSLQAR
jgi:hypothetical protein